MGNFFFGYGSLVNRATHSYPDAVPARLKGWRRQWCGTNERRLAFLTAIRDETAEIDGLIARVEDTDWAALDERERAYLREDALHAVTPRPALAKSLVVYAVPEGKHLKAGEHAILLSYIDVVVQGYLQVFGLDGAQRFFATTTGWEQPILNDRAQPVYSRHQTLTPEETALVDENLAKLSAVVKEL